MKTMWIASGKYKEINEDFLFDQIPTFKGQSGSPIFKMVGENAYIVGIHIRGEIKK